jgi:hypothetical protein
MTDSMTLEKRLKVKNEWVDIFFKLGKPLLKLANSYDIENQPYPTFILEK